MDILSKCRKNAVLNLPLSFQSSLEIAYALISKPYLQWIKVGPRLQHGCHNVNEICSFSGLERPCMEKKQPGRDGGDRKENPQKSSQAFHIT
jgi:hypothetical protein